VPYPGPNPASPCNPDTSRGVSLSVASGTAMAIRFPTQVNVKTSSGNVSSSCVVVAFLPSKQLATDGTMQVPTQQLFVPTNSTAEFQDFVTAMQQPAASSMGAQFWDCDAEFQHAVETNRQLAFEGAGGGASVPLVQYPNPITTPNGPHTTFSTWVGSMTCDSLAQRPACDQTRMISAQRRCQLENGANGQDLDCANANDPDGLAASTNLASWGFGDTQAGGAIQDNPLEQPITQFKADGKTPGNVGMYMDTACFALSSAECPSANVPAGHVFCLSPEIKITMGDGTEKAIKEIKAGEEVMAFNAKQSRSSAMGKATVKATAITKNQAVVQINDLKITPLHKVVLATGRAVLAKDVKVGDKLLMGNGQVMVVSTVKAQKKKITVYNLVLDQKSDGYIAGGVRVMSYPLMPEMEVTSGHAAAKKAGGTPTRNISSVKDQ